MTNPPSRVGRNILSALALAAVLGAGFGVGRATANQPHMVKAKEHLLAARSELQAATDNKGGHKAKALASVNEAIEQVDKGIAFAKN